MQRYVYTRPPGSRYPAAQATEVRKPANPQALLQKIEAEQFKNLGNEYRKAKLYNQAVSAYQSAIRVNPLYTDAYFNLAQLFAMMGQVPQGIKTLNALLTVDSNDHDARVLLGEYWERMGNTQEAKRRYMEVVEAKPDFDPARRRLNYLLYLDQHRFYPETAQALLKTRYKEVLHHARELLKQYFLIHHPNPVLQKLSQDILIVFEETQKTDESANIAEYDAYKKLIRVQPQMLFSTPNVVAAYLAHELVHALDEDPYSSILEEQDAYQALARFWGIYQGSDNDPNLDRAAALYQQSTDRLNQEVRRVYSIEDSAIPEKSPGHGLPANNLLSQQAQSYDRQFEQVRQERLKRLLAYQGQR